MKWQTKEQLTNLLCELVKIPSVTGSKDEKIIPSFIAEQLRSLTYFQQYPDDIQLHPTGDGRSLLTALVRSKSNVKETIVLVSHFDVVNTEDYGDWYKDAFDPIKLTEMFYKHKELLPEEAKKDIESGDWLFGRGVMDMKSGLALHMSMIEKAADGEFEGNILLLTVPDEEVGSAGMLAAISVLNNIAENYKLEYITVVNSEPTFPKSEVDRNNYIYKGSIGKMLPGFFCYGKETHVGEPLSGVNANQMVAAVINEMELNAAYCEILGQDITPPPTNLLMKSLKNDYSVQTPNRAVAYFNLLMLERSIDEYISMLVESAKRAATSIELHYAKQVEACRDLELVKMKNIKINVLTFEELYSYAVNTYGQNKVDAVYKEALQITGPAGERDTTIAVVDHLVMLCKELGPIIVLFISPPYYPAICSREDILVEATAKKLTLYAQKKYQVNLKHENYMRGITDLSYVGSHRSFNELNTLMKHMPLWDNGYSIPLQEMKTIIVPVINLGPLGMDAHRWTERLDINNAFVVLADLLPYCIKTLFLQHSRKSASTVI